MPEILIYTHYWGPECKNMFETYCLPSCFGTGNIDKLLAENYPVKWRIYCDNAPVLPDKPIFEIVNREGNKEALVKSFIEIINETKNKNIIILIVMPDCIIGNNTLYNAVKLIENKKGICLCVPHARISIEKLAGKTFDYETMPNNKLLNLCFQYGHTCLVDTFDNKDVNLTWEGISIRKISEDTFAVIHNLATPFACQFNDDDYGFFKNNLFSEFDRKFIKLLKDTGRVKLCGSNEFCFQAEITSERHKPQLRSELLNNDKHSGGHNYFNDCIVLWKK